MSPAAQAGNIEIFLGDNNDLEQDDDEEIENPLNQECDDDEQAD